MLYLRESGPADAPTIVFLHGEGVSGWMWRSQVEQLSDYHCLVPDLPEHGRSISQGPFTIRGAASQIAEIIRTRARGKRANVVGLSLGGQIAVQLLASSPDILDHVLMSGSWCGAFAE